MKECGNFGGCIYNTTAGCISPFNCPYKIEEESITTNTSTPLSPIGINTTETDKDNEIARLTAENERLKEQTKDFEVLYAGIKNGEVDMSVRGTTLKAITACFIQAFIQNGGTNFFLYDLKDDDGNKYSVTIQKANGKTPAEMLHESKAENAELKARLEKAVELPCCKVGDTVYWIEKWRTEPQIDEYTVHGFMIDTTNEKVCIRVKLDKDGFFVPLVGEYKDKQLFFDRAKAEARLAELKGGEGE